MNPASVRFNSIKMRLVAAMLLLTVLPAIIVGWMAHDLVFERIRSERMKAVGRVADAKHDQLNMLLNRANNRARLFLADMNIRCVAGKPDRSCVNRLMESYLVAEGAIGATLHLKDERLNVGTPAPARSAVFQPGQLAAFPGTGRGNNQSYFISVAVADLRLDVVYPSTNLQPIFDRPAELGESGETFLADGEGYFVTHNRYSSKQGHSEHIHASPMQSCLRGEDREVLDLDYRDAEIIHGYRMIPEFGSACIMAHIDQAEAFAPLGRLQQQLILMAMVFFVVVFFVAILLARNIARPIEGLTRVARRITSGDFQARAEEGGNDEIAELAGSFNSMTDQLKQKIAELGETEERYRKLFEEASDAIAIADAKSGELLDLNQAFADLLGWERTELIGKPQRMLHPNEPEVTVSPTFEQHRSTKAGQVIETVAIRRDGQLFDVAIKAAPMELDGRNVVLASFRDITARKLAERKLADSYRKLQQLSLHLERVREEERARVALELHDEMGSTLTALKMSIHWLASKLPSGSAQFADEMEHMSRLVSDAIHTMRHIVSQLRPIQLRELGFAAAVDRYVHNFQKSMGIECSLVLPEDDADLDEDQAAAVFRILQEALNNVAKHARASRVKIIFARRNHSLLLLVQDDGIGFDPIIRKNASFGLVGIKERALMGRGRARIGSAPGKGTRVAVRIVLSSPAR